jgi:Protein of unknown function (DUF2917)
MPPTRTAKEPAMNITIKPATAWTARAAWFGFIRPARPLRSLVDAAAWADPVHTLARGSTLRIECPLGTEVACLDGILWITHDDEPQDHIVEPGMPYIAHKSSTMLVHALADARCVIVQPIDC